MRSFRLNLDFFRKFCADAFGEGTWAKVDLKNLEYGGLYDKSTNIIFSNGIEGNYFPMQTLGDGPPCSILTMRIW
jgi:hypothetical protein